MKKIIPFLMFTVVYCSIKAQTLTPVLLDNLNDDSSFFGKNSNPSSFKRAGNNLYFTANTDVSNFFIYADLFVTDGTTPGTVSSGLNNYVKAGMTCAIPWGNNMVVVNDNNVLLSDGTFQGEALITDTLKSAFSNVLSEKWSFIIGNDLFVWMDLASDTLGIELYKTDGTQTGTTLFKDYYIGSGNGTPHIGGGGRNTFQVNQTEAYFLAYNGDSLLLNKTNGTLVGTQVIHKFKKNELVAGNNYSEVSIYQTPINNHMLIFDGLKKIWSLDLATDQIVQLDSGALFTTRFIINNELYYTDRIAGNITSLIATDGITTRIVKTNGWTEYANSVLVFGYESNQHEVGGKSFFTIHPPYPEPIELWITDGTDGGTVKVLDSLPQYGGGSGKFYVCGNKTYYYLYGGSLKTLYEIDAQNNTLIDVMDLTNVTSFYYDEGYGRFYFGYDDGVIGMEPYYTTCDMLSSIADEVKNVGVKIYPNPNQTGSLNIDFEGDYDLFIYNINGQLVKTIANQKDNSVIDISELKQGIYFVQLIGTKNNTTQKLIKK
ncbi:MAG: T9SS type A sorting domain-containing protein [Flavobacteriales bacterium]|nr:T9SS type A sorting domain-containing protein [Flavobacteriales bacterium]